MRGNGRVRQTILLADKLVQTAVIILLLTAVLLTTALGVQWYLDGRNFLADLIERRRLNRRTLSEWDVLREQTQDRSDIIISLTTIPERIALIAPTIKSLIAQSRQAARILLWIPNDSVRSGMDYVLPEWLQGLEGLEIHRCKDMGPATKFLYAVRENKPDTRILIVDDDKIYPQGFVEQIEKQSDLFPDYALGYSGWRVPADLTDRPTTLWMNIRRKPPAPMKSAWVKGLYPVDILQGYSGYLVKPRFFKVAELWDYSEAPAAAFYVDDVWISAHCRVPKMVFKAKRFCIEPFVWRSHYRKTSLGMQNRGKGTPADRNNTVMIKFFSDRWQH